MIFKILWFLNRNSVIIYIEIPREGKKLKQAKSLFKKKKTVLKRVMISASATSKLATPKFFPSQKMDDNRDHTQLVPVSQRPNTLHTTRIKMQTT